MPGRRPSQCRAGPAVRAGCAPVPRGGRAQASQVEHGVRPAGPQLLANAPAHAPHLAHLGGGQVAHLGQLGGMATGFALGRLSNVVGQLGRGLGGCNAHHLQDPVAYHLDPLGVAAAHALG